MRMRRVVICGLPGSTIFFNILINGTICGKMVIEHKSAFDFLYNFCLKHFSFYEEMGEVWSKMYIGLHVKNRLFWLDFNETWIFSIDFRKYSNITFNENWFSGSRVVPCRQTDMTKRIAAFRNFANVHNKRQRMMSLWAGITESTLAD